MTGLHQSSQSTLSIPSYGTIERHAIPTLQEILTSNPDEFVAKYADIAAINLACARGLPNAYESEFLKYLTLLDTIADAVRRETDRNWRLFELKPAQFHNSEAVFRLYVMEHVFRVRFNIKYDPLVHALIDGGSAWNTSDSSEIFIHGILSEKRTGTCSSLPTFAIAVGRRLGYPLKLVSAPNHTLYRWDDGDEVWNFQHTESGGDVRPDEYFYQWPRKWDKVDYAINERTRVWLHSMTPMQEVSKFLCNRALLLRNIGRFSEALRAIDAAARFNPINPACGEIRFDILQQTQGPVGWPAVQTAVQATQIYIDQGLDELFANVAFMSHLMGSAQPQARADGDSTAPQMRNPSFEKELEP